MAPVASRTVWRNRIATVAVLVGALSLIGYLYAMLLKSSPAEHRKVQQIFVLQAPPPPPPKPPEKPPEPPKPQEEIKLDQPKPVDEPKQAQEPPPAGPLGVDAQGTGPGDAFGLAGRPGGRDITLAGSGGGNALGFSTFARTTARFIAQELARDGQLRATHYRVEVLIWLSNGGRVDRFQLVHGTGDTELDQRIRDGLAQVGSLRQSVPQGLPQPLRIRVTSSDV
jgi:periplasmic protein TonB